MGFDLRGLVQGAVNAAPYAQQALMKRKMRDESEQDRLLQRMHGIRADQRADMDSTQRYEMNAASINHMNTQTEALRKPTPEKPGEYELIDTPDGMQRVPKVGKPGIITGANGQPLRKSLPATDNDLTPHNFTLNGQAVSGFTDKQGSFYDSSHQKVTGKVTPYAPPPAPDRATEVVEDPANPDGAGIITPRAQAIGKHAPGKPKAENAMQIAAKARLEAAVSEMNNAHSNMDAFEQGLLTGRIKISAGAQVLQRMANAFTHDDPVSQMTQSGALAMLNKTDPELARYIRRGLSFAEGESMVSQRPSDFRTKMAAFLSTAGSGASPEMIHDIAGRRSAILNPLNATVKPSPAKGAGGGAGGDPESAWAKLNPPAAGESFDAYHQRYLKSRGGGGDEDLLDE